MGFVHGHHRQNLVNKESLWDAYEQLNLHVSGFWHWWSNPKSNCFAHFSSCCHAAMIILSDSFCNCQVGISTILEDAAGDHIQLGLYNQLPGGAVGPRSVKLAQRHFPKGAHVRIAEPFLKIFRDGKRGVRVDDPRVLSRSFFKICSISEYLRLFSLAKQPKFESFALNVFDL